MAQVWLGSNPAEETMERGNLPGSRWLTGISLELMADPISERDEMPELRHDPISGHWVIIAEERGKRPHDTFSISLNQNRTGDCPFCAGHEAQTPPEVFAIRDATTAPNSPGWEVRIFPNKFPALSSVGAINHQGNGLEHVIPGIGVHEVVVESPDHLLSLGNAPTLLIHNVLVAYRDRLNLHKLDPRMVHGIVFKNVGSAGGSSLEHTHSQIMVLPLLPATIKQELIASQTHFENTGHCLFCQLIELERATATRIVFENELFVAFCPFASRFPYETWIVPRNHESHFGKIENAELEDLSRILKFVLNSLETSLNCPPYNYLIHSAPFGPKDLEHYHWHIEVIPRLTQIAGFELGTDMFINPTAPEAAALLLRQEPGS